MCNSYVIGRRIQKCLNDVYEKVYEAYDTNECIYRADITALYEMMFESAFPEIEVSTKSLRE